MTEAAAVLSRAGLDELVAALIADGYRVIGPVRRDDAIVLAELSSGAQLPSGWGVESAPGRYRLRRRSDEAVFGHSAGPQGWKQFVHPPRQLLWSADGEGGFSPAADEPPRQAFLGVRACDLAAIATLGAVLGGGAHPDGAGSVTAPPRMPRLNRPARPCAPPRTAWAGRCRRWISGTCWPAAATLPPLIGQLRSCGMSDRSVDLVLSTFNAAAEGFARGEDRR